MGEQTGADRTAWEGEMFRRLAENVLDYAIFVVDPHRHVLTWTKGAERLLGFTEEEIVGQKCDRFFTPDDVRDGVPQRELEKALATGRGEDDRWHTRKDGSRFWSSGVATPLRDGGGTLRGFAVILRDGTALKRSQDALQDALAYAEGIVDTVREPLLVLDADLRVMRANRSFYRTFRVRPQDAEGRLLYDLGNGQWDIPALRHRLADVLPRGTAFEDFEVEHDFPGLGRKVMVLNARKLRQAGDHAELILLAVEDVTAFRRAEEERRELETRFTSLVQNIKDHSIFTTDPAGRVTSWNVEAERILGFSEAEILGQNFSVIFTPEDIDGGVPERERRLASRDGRAEDERWHVRKGGERFWALGIVTPTHDAAGKHTGYSKILRDMTDRKKSEDAVRASEAHKAAVLRASLDAIVTTDGGGVVVEFNPAAESLFGYTLAEAAGADLGELLVPVRMREGHREGMARFHATGEAPVLNVRLEMPARRKDGSEITVELVITRLGIDPPLFTGFVRDITTRKEAEAALAERGRLLALGAAVGTALVEADTLKDCLQRCARALVEHLGGAFARVWTLDPGGAVLQLQASAGLYTHLDGPHSRVPVGQYKIGLIAQERQPHLTNAVVGDDRVGDQGWAVREGMVAFAGYPLLVGGRVVGVMAMFARHALSDATLGAMASVANAVALGVEKKQAEGRLEEQREWLRTTLSSIGDAVIATDTAGRVTFLNPVAEVLTGWPQAEARGRDLGAVFRIVHERTRLPAENPVARVLREGSVVGLANHTVLIARGGGEKPIDDSAAPIRDERGRLRGVVLVFRDVSDKRRAEEQARTILESITDAFFAVGRDWRFTYLNRQAEALLARTSDDLLGKHLWEEFAPAVGSDFYHGYHRAVAEGVAVTFEAFYPPLDRWFEVHAYPSPDGLSVYFRDATGRRRAEDDLRTAHRELEVRVADRTAELTRTNEFLKALLENVQDGIVACDGGGVLTLFNRATRELHGLPEEAIPAERWADHYRLYRPDARTPMATGDVPLYRALQGERVRDAEMVIAPDRLPPRTVLASGQAFYDGEGVMLGAVVSMHDVTLRKRAEEGLRRANEELERRVGERTAELAAANAALTDADRRKDEFLATLAHELRNPLAPIRNGLQVIRLAGAGGTVEQARSMMERQLTQLVRLVDDLLDVSRVTTGKLDLRRERVDVRAVVAAAVETSRPAIEQAGHAFVVALPDEPMFVDGDATRLAQVVSNLLNNSAKYTHRGGHIRLAVGREGGVAVVSVADDGIGIPPAMLGRVFEMFTQVDRTLEKTTGGLGIGLSLVKGLVEMHGGTIEARSGGEGQGSEFTVRLPVATPGASRADHSHNKDEEVEPARRRILVVDDNADSANSLGQLLELLGNEVRTAYDGEAGVGAAAAFRPDLILMDIGMPKVNGYDAARRIRAEPWGKDVVLVALTGWGQDEDRQKSTDAGFDRHLVKPVEYAALTKVLGGLEPATG